jgi:hypothetical protein
MMDENEIHQMDEFAALVSNILFSILWVMVCGSAIVLAWYKLTEPSL